MAEAAAAPVITGNQYSEAQHFSLLKSAVEQATVDLTTAKSDLEAQVATLESEKAATATELSEAKTKIDLLEADKATAEAAAETARTELATFKTEIERSAQIAALKDARKSRVQTANASLTDGFFSDERVQRWAEMSDDAFDAFVTDMTEMAKALPVITSTTTSTEAARETAAFAGGTSPTADDNKTSTLTNLLDARRRGAIA